MKEEHKIKRTPLGEQGVKIKGGAQPPDGHDDPFRLVNDESVLSDTQRIMIEKRRIAEMAREIEALQLRLRYMYEHACDEFKCPRRFVSKDDARLLKRLHEDTKNPDPTRSMVDEGDEIEIEEEPIRRIPME